MREPQEDREQRRCVMGCITSFVVVYLSGLALLTSSCSSSATARMPYPACLYDMQRRYDTGHVIARRESDDALLFEFNDHTKGDNGFRWVTPGGNRTIAPCREATLMDAADPMRMPPPPFEPEVKQR